MPKTDSRLAISALFAVLLLGAAGFTAFSLDYLGTWRGRIAAIERTDAEKTGYINEMYRAARERGMLLMKMTATQDPFLLNEQLEELDLLATRFIAARDALHAMPLSEAEIWAYQEFQDAMIYSASALRKVAELLDVLAYRQAGEVLAEDAIPAQDSLVRQLEGLRDLQNAATREDLARARQGYRQAKFTVLGGGAGFFAVSSALVFLLARRVRRNEESLNRRGSATLHAMGNGVITIDTRCRITYMNPEAEALTGWRAREALGRPLLEVFQLLNRLDEEMLRPPLKECLERGEMLEFSNNLLLLCRDGREYAVESTAAPLRDHHGKISGAVLVFHDIGKTSTLDRQLVWQARHDALTGVLNRREFYTHLEAAVASARRESRSHALAYLDLDQFKVINDTCGHAAGDDLLQHVAEQLGHGLREGDSLARLSGDEFGILFLDSSLHKARQRLEALREMFQVQRFTWEGRRFEISLSIGLVGIGAGDEDPEKLLGSADIACQLAKDAGRNRVVTVQPGTDVLAKHHTQVEWVTRINEAIESSRLRLYKQAIVPVARAGDGLPYAEVLLRMQDPAGRLVPPGIFLPAAERYNLMRTIDRWVVQHTFASLEGRADHRYAINLSGHSMNDEGFLDYLLLQLERYKIVPELLCFEITETAVMANLEGVTRFIGALKERGCCFALDDFGAGMSSYAYLKNLPVDYLKIDGGFVRNVATDPISRAMVESINALGHTMRLRTVAEYVEDEAILNVLRQLGVDYAQGYLFGEPSPLV